jgi:PDZ domain-containing protein
MRLSIMPDMRAGMSMRIGILLLLVTVIRFPATAEVVVEIPVLAGITANNRGVFEILLAWWDQQPEPQPIALQWRYGGVLLKETHLGAMAKAFRYAIDRTPAARHTGTVSVQGIAYAPTSSDGPSAGAAMTVGFIALFKGEHLQRGVAITGTIESGGSIGSVGMIPDKVRAAAREGYRTVLIPAGQLHDPRWRLGELALELNVTLKEVGTIDEAYELMTGHRL